MLHKIIFFIFLPLNIGAIDIIVFSYNRPIQAYALLESVEKYVSPVDTVYILYRADNSEYEHGYQETFNSFPSLTICPFKQGGQPRRDFKPILMNILDLIVDKYLIFAVDDIIVKDYINIEECTQALDGLPNIYAFYLRLGNNISFSYSHQKKSHKPHLKQLENGMLTWKFNTGTFDWNYPNSVDFTIFRSAQVKKAIQQLNFTAPNVFEGKWAGQANHNGYGICYEKSKIVNLPLNLVQNDCPNNPHMNLYSSGELLTFFKQGLKINIDDLYQIDNISPHMNFSPHFITR